MYVITKRSENIEMDLFYWFHSDQKDLSCTVTDTINTCRRYTETEKQYFENNPATRELLELRKVKFRKIGVTFI